MTTLENVLRTGDREWPIDAVWRMDSKGEFYEVTTWLDRIWHWLCDFLADRTAARTAKVFNEIYGQLALSTGVEENPDQSRNRVICGMRIVLYYVSTKGTPFLETMKRIDERFGGNWGAFAESYPEESRIVSALETIEASLARWESTGNIAEAKRRILTCVRARSITLELSNLGLSSLPDLSALKALRVIHCHHNLLTSLGDLSALTALQWLTCSDNQLTSLGDLSALTALQWLYCHNNLLTSLGDLSALAALYELFGPYNRLTSIPISLLALPRDCVVNLENNLFSDTVIEQALVLFREGPRIRYNRRPQETLPSEISNKPPSELIPAFQAACEDEALKTYRFDTLWGNEASRFSLWLIKLQWTADWKNDLTRKLIAYQVLALLRFACENGEFRDQLLAGIMESTESCGDRIAVVLTDLDINRRLTENPKIPTEELLRLLKGTLALDLLNKIAAEKVKTLSMVDEVEVYLGYKVFLKERLCLPIDLGGMLYPRCSQLTDADLNSAEAQVNEKLSDVTYVAAELAEHSIWQGRLKQIHADEYKRAEEDRQKRLAELEDNAQYLKKVKALQNELPEWFVKKTQDYLRPV